MFGLSKLFSSKSVQKQPIIAALAGYRSAAFAVGVDEKFINGIELQSDHSVLLNLTLPFAALSEMPKVAEFVSQKLKQTVVINAHVELPKACKFKSIKHIVLVASGKGGVGKSTTAVNLAGALNAEGAKVGILDADIYGPSIPMLLGLSGAAPTAQDDKQLLPFDANGIKAQSIGFLVPSDDATVWRGPMASGAVNQLLNETAWGELDYLIVDMPPGTGDIQLTMSQKVPASGAVIVTTPQDLALADAQKGIAMFNKVNVPVLGMIENMSHFLCSHCGEPNHVFGKDGAIKLAQRHGVPVLSKIPLAIDIREYSEQGKLIAMDNQAAVSKTYADAARLIASTLYYQQPHHDSVEIVITDD
ncbi:MULTISPECIES: iron-sulfur cluster carrier protein ApbC [Pseudoalteromonas]|uniref:Iron-sulfur cluster carrier protein n=1 Tax=Pseudoalteromonas haloplanktis TaxID=228 RepID=A0ABU1B919_PSEHA|nr:MULTISPECIES: iron-sulfur cluster carrier protein ApbC [Pseudoalteromonas]MDQ9090928.1 iron-sulfur cluster carrier protein ApbC [Pseudoalteromonas haloplanktis]TMN69643.1 iron-sulfur cluster carrier protein ApbC [Pseudoalteromonas sp. S1727]BDF94561.1 iron-sulfur cluster carrier protein [Pseudoalteromonas sp. KAN5]